MRHFLWLLMIGLMVGGLGCETFEDAFGDDDDDDNRNTRQQVVNRSISPDEFVREAASAGMWEIESSQLIIDRRVGGETEALARELIREHQRANDELRRVAEANRIPVTPSMTSNQRERLERLRESANNNELVERYRNMQQQAHDEAIQLFERAANNISNPDLREYAQRTLPTLREHRNDLRQHSNQ